VPSTGMVDGISYRYWSAADVQRMRDTTLLAHRRSVFTTSLRRLTEEMARAQALLAGAYETMRRTHETMRRAQALHAAAFAQLERMEEVRARMTARAEHLHRSPHCGETRRGAHSDARGLSRRGGTSGAGAEGQLA
jgi:hypothetical protein